MTPEKYNAMLQSLDLNKLAAAVPADVVTAVTGHGLHKVAAVLTGIPEITESTAAMYLGRKLASRRAEQQAVNAGMVALASLGK